MWRMTQGGGKETVAPSIQLLTRKGADQRQMTFQTPARGHTSKDRQGDQARDTAVYSHAHKGQICTIHSRSNMRKLP